MNISPHRSKVYLVFAWLILATVIFIVYFPGLSGDYVFDDLSNIVNNAPLHIGALDWSGVRSAIGSGDAGPLGRPLSVLSFALNFYATGLDPFFFKLTNLSIHLGNTLLVGLVAQVLLRKLLNASETPFRSYAEWSGWMAAALWGLHPLNLTSVLYVVQRMTSLSTFFGLSALFVYAAWRARPDGEPGAGRHARRAIVACVVAILLTASVFSKESGILFVLLLLWIEYMVFDFRTAGVPLRVGKWPMRSIVGATLVLAAMFAIAFVIPRLLSAAAFANRDFTLTERGVTESRVLFYYLRLVAFPSNSELSLYHDDFEISSGFLNPPSTIISLLGLVVVSALAIFWRKRQPMLLFSWGWFLISHALESTIFPLELVHEHRNYFATIGIVIAIPVVLQKWLVNWGRSLLLFIGVYGLLLAAVTWTRAEQWSNNVDNALIEAINHPRSARANYNLGRIYLRLLDKTGEGRFGPLAERAFGDAISAYKPGIGPYFALLHSAYYTGKEPSPEIVNDLKQGLRALPFYNENISFLQAFLTCQVERHCRMPDMEVVEIFIAALENSYASPRAKGEVYKLLAQYFMNRFGDIDKGIEFIGDALALRDDPSTRIMYAQAYRLKGMRAEAAAQIAKAQSLDKRKVYKREITREQAAQDAAFGP